MPSASATSAASSATAVVHSIDAIAERLGDERSLLGDGKIGRACGGDDDEPYPPTGLRADDQEPRLGVIGMGKTGLGDGAGDGLVGSRGEDVGVVVGEAPHDRDHLRGGLARAEHGLGSTAAQRPVVVHLGEPEILVRQPSELPDRGVDVDAPGLHVFEKRSDGFPIHRSLSAAA